MASGIKGSKFFGVAAKTPKRVEEEGDNDEMNGFDMSAEHATQKRGKRFYNATELQKKQSGPISKADFHKLTSLGP